MSMIDVSHLTFGYDGSYDMVFEDATFRLDTDWKTGFVGRNGRGKTTFLHLLQGKMKYAGTIHASVDFAYFPFAVKEENEMTWEAAQQAAPQAEQWQLIRELNLLEVDPEVLYRPFCSLSPGEKGKVLLSALFLKENVFLLIDEPTNHMDQEARERLAEYLKKKQGFLLVSHDRAFLDGCVDHILTIQKTKIVVQKGNYSTWDAQRLDRQRAEMEENQRLKREIKRLSAAVEATKNWSQKLESTKKGERSGGGRPHTGYIGHRAAKMMKRSKSLERRQQETIEEKAALLKDVEEAPDLKVTPLNYGGRRLLEAKDLSLYYGEKKVCGPLHFEVRSGERICIRGKNGAGKSSLLRLILGQPLQHTGELLRGGGLKISYVDQDTSGLRGDLNEFAHQREIDQTLLKTILRKLGFSREQFDQKLERLSDGQKKKVLIAGSLCQQAHLYIWDEPLNFIDVLSRGQIEELLLKGQPTMLFVEHDSVFQEKIATKILSLES